MENGKKLIALLLCVCMVLPLFGCGNKEEAGVKGLDSAQEAIELLKKCSEEYGYENAWSELTEKSTMVVDGDSYYRLQQNYQGIPVYGRTVVFAVDENGYALSLTGNTADVDEGLDLIPTVTKEQLEASIRAYFSKEMGAESAEYLEIGELSEAELCIYHADNRQRSYLAYKLNAGGWEILADAHDGSVLFTRSWLDSAAATGYLASDTEQKNGFMVEQEDNGRFALIDTARGLIVYDMQGKDSDKDKISGDAYVTSADNIFGNDPVLETEHEKGAILLQNASRISGFYRDILNFKPETEYVFLYYNDKFDSGENARGGIYGNGTGTIFLGEVTGVEDIDVFSHEYGHVISHTLVDLDGSTIENGAINEGISDIFGEITEAWFYGWGAPDWIMKGDNISLERNIKEPHKSDRAENVTDSYSGLEKFFGKEENNYYYSTVISHAAYLMWNGIDGTSAKRISDIDLLKLWYRAMLLMPSDCDFAGCRTMVELAAESMALTAEQKICIGEAFDAVGIQRSDDQKEAYDYIISPDSTLSVYDADGIPFSGYTLSISSPESNSALIRAFNKIFVTQNRYVSEEIVETAGPHLLDLPEGRYDLTVSNGDPSDPSYTYRIKIDDLAPKEDIPVYTDYIPRLIVVLNGEETEQQTPVDKKITCVNVYDGDRLDERHMLSYNEKQQLTGIVSEYFDPADEEPEVVNNTYTYDDAGRLIRMDYDEQPLGPSHDDFYYNEQGQLSLHQFYMGETGLHWDDVCEYDESGNILTVRELYPADESPTGSCEGGVTTYTYEYDEQGRVSRSIGKYIWDPDSPENYDYRVSCYTYDSNGALDTKREATLTKEEYESALQQGWDQLDFDTVFQYKYKPFVVRTRDGSTTFLLNDITGNELSWFYGGDSITLDEDGYVVSALDTVYGYRSEFIYDGAQGGNNLPTSEDREDTINALNTLLVGVQFKSGQGSSDVLQWTDRMICETIGRKLLWDSTMCSDPAYSLESTGLESSPGENGYAHYDLESIQKITQDTLGRDFPSEKQVDWIFASGNEVLLIPGPADLRFLTVQDYTKQGDKLVAVGTITECFDMITDTFCGYFQAVFQENPSSLYGYTLLSLRSVEGNQSFDYLIAEASSVLTEASDTHDAGNVLDGNLKTSWVEGVNGSGVNEWIIISTEDGSQMDISAIEFALGYQKSGQLLDSCGWPKKILIECEDGYQETFNFFDHILTVKVLNRGVKTSWIKFTILDAEAGTKYNDTGITEIRFYGIDTSAYFAEIDPEDIF